IVPQPFHFAHNVVNASEDILREGPFPLLTVGADSYPAGLFACSTLGHWDRHAGLAFLPWHPLAAGGDAAGGGALGRVARRRGATPMQVAIAWLLARSRVIVPIPGTSSVAHLDENVAAARILLSTEDLHELS